MILVFKFSDIKLFLVKILHYLPYTPEKTNYNVKKYATHLWCGAVCCGPGLVGRSVSKCPGPIFGPKSAPARNYTYTTDVRL